MPKFPLPCLLAAIGFAALAAPVLADDDAPAESKVLICGVEDTAEERECIVIDGDSAAFIVIEAPADETFEADPVPLPPLA